MQAIKHIAGRAISIPIKDIDTDAIIPAEFLTSTSKTGYGAHLFKRFRETDPNFVLNTPAADGAAIFIADHNFGCGSSREHAVWAILDAGFKAVIAKSFADIFFSNAAKNGLLLIVLPEDAVDHMMRQTAAGDYQISIDLAELKLTTSDERQYGFSYDSFRQHCLLNGLEDIDYLLANREKIDAFRKRQSGRYFDTLTPNHNLEAKE